MRKGRGWGYFFDADIADSCPHAVLKCNKLAILFACHTWILEENKTAITLVRVSYHINLG